MYLNKGILLGGLPIHFNNPLNVIYQPKLNEIYSNNMMITEFSRPFSLIRMNQKYFEETKRPLMFFLNFCDKIRQENGMRVDVEFIKALSLLYKTKIDNIRVAQITDSIILNILNNDGREIGIITDENLIELADTVLQMMDMKIVTETKLIGEKEVVDKFEQRRREYAEKQRKKREKQGIKEELAGDEENELVFYNMINYIIHQQEFIDYNSVMNMTVWQMRNSYESLSNKALTDRFVNSGSVNWKADGFVNWVEKVKYKK